MLRKERDKLVDNICASVRRSYSGLKSVQSLSFDSVRLVLDVAKKIVTDIEDYNYYVESLSGPEKKTLAVEVLNRLINIDVKFVPRFLMDRIEGWIINKAINYAVDFFNERLGKEWFI